MGLRYHEVCNLNDWKSKNYVIEYDDVEFSELNEETWVLMPNDLKPIFGSVSEQSIELEQLIGSENIFNGIQTSKNEIYVQVAERDDEDYSMHEIELETERDYRRNSIIEEEKELDENQYSSSSSSEGIEIESQSIVSLGDNKE